MCEDSNFRFRRLEASDLEEIKVLQDHLFPVKYSDHFYNSLVNEPEVMMTLLATDECDKPIGVVTARVRRDNPRLGYIATLGVRDDYRRRGLGSELLEKMVTHLDQNRRVERIHLHVKSDNESALKLYEKHGFTKKQYLEQHYYFDDQHHDAWELEKYVQTPPSTSGPKYTTCVLQ